MEAIRSRAFTYTINNYTSEDLKPFLSEKIKKQCKYYIFGFEVGKTGTPHIQGYIYFHNAKKFKEVKTYIPRGHIECAHGTVEQNISYTTKDDKYIEWGEKPIIGKRNDLTNIKIMVMNNTPVKDIIPIIDNYQQLSFMEKLMKYSPPPKREAPIIKWYYGASGSGKTRQAIKEGGDDYYISMKNLQWWDGYTGQKTVIIDDFRADFCTFHELLRITDRYPYRVNIKGASIWLQATTIIFTSCYKPDEVYNTREDIVQLIRRITNIQEFKINIQNDIRNFYGDNFYN